MPPFFDAIVDVASRFLSGVNQSNPSSFDANDVIPDAAASDPSHAPNKSGIEQASPPAIESTPKRLRQVHEKEDAGPRKKQRGASADEKRLTGDYETPRNATAIHIPTYDGGSSGDQERPCAGRMGGQFRPIDTLHQARHAPGTGFGTNGRLSGTRTVGNRQKMGQAKRTSDLPSDPIDITDDDSLLPDDVLLAAKPGQRKGDRYPPVSRRGIDVPPVADYFNNKESRAVDNTFRIPKEKNARKRKSSASQSSQAPSLEIVHGKSARSHGTRARPVEVPDDSQIPPQTLSGTPKRRRIEQHVELSARPPIDLTKGMPAPPMVIVNRGGREDGGVQEQSTRDRPFARFATKEPVAGRTSPQLNDQFRRDAGTARKYKTSQLMQTESRQAQRELSTVGDISSSPDELQGEKTVGSGTTRRMSPLKQQRSVSNLSIDRSSPTSGRDPSLSRVKRTVPMRPHLVKQDQQTSAPLPIRAFYASSFASASGDIALVYDSQNQTLEVLKAGKRMSLPDKQRVISISEAEAREVQHNKDSTLVHLKGSITDVSNGHICVEFHDHHGVEWFINMVCGFSNDGIKMTHEPLDRLKDIFLTQSGELEKASKMRHARASELGEKSSLPKHGTLARLSRENDDAELALHQTENAPRTNARKRMQAMPEPEPQQSEPAARSEMQSALVSRLFPDDAAPASRKSTRQVQPQRKRTPSPSPVRWTRENQPKRWLHSVEYPSSGAKRVVVDFPDLERLDEGSFLNDNIINFALRQIEEQMDPKYKDSVHFFNTFFYTSFTTRDGHKVANNYDAVKRWTKKKDIFSTPFVVVPINIRYHWFVAIICNLPSLSRKATGLDHDEDEKQAVAEETGVQMPNEQSGSGSNGARTRDETDGMRTLTLAEGNGETLAETAADADGDERIRYEMSGDDGEKPTEPVQHGNSSSKTKVKKVPPGRKYPPDIPAIITLDSLGDSHAAEIRYLKDYLKSEAEEKRGMNVVGSALQGITAKGIPEQTNFCDCGLYLVGYVQEFAKNPREFISKVLSRQLDSQADFAAFSPSEKRAEIREELLKLNEVQESERQAKKRLKSGRTVAGKGLEKQSIPGDATQPKAEATGARNVSEPIGPRALSASAETSMPASMKGAVPAAIDDPAEREMEPARAPRKTSAQRPATIQAIEEQPGSANAPRTDEQEDADDMLDNMDYTDAAHAQPTQAPNPDLGKSPLSALDKIMAHGPLTSGKEPPATQLDSSERMHNPTEDDDEERPEVESTRKQDSEPVSPTERPDEIPDSQEKEKSRPHASWQGKRTVFND